MKVRVHLYFSDRAATDVLFLDWIRSIRKTDRQQAIKQLMLQAVEQNPSLLNTGKLPRRELRVPETGSHQAPTPPQKPDAPLPEPTVPSLAMFGKTARPFPGSSHRQ